MISIAPQVVQMQSGARSHSIGTAVVWRQIDGEPDDLLKERLSALRAERDLAKAALGRIRDTSPGSAEISPVMIERLGCLMREHVTSGEIPFRKAWLQAIVDRVEVGADVIRIVGDEESL